MSTKYDFHQILKTLICQLGQQKCKKNIFEKYKKFPKYELYLCKINLLQGLLNNLERWIKTRFCILSPLLSHLFINYIPDVLEGGCIFGGIRVNVSMYADDIVLIAPTENSLQRMIAYLKVYFGNWNLRINLNKSKILGFQKRWYCNKKMKSGILKGKE